MPAPLVDVAKVFVLVIRILLPLHSTVLADVVAVAANVVALVLTKGSGVGRVVKGGSGGTGNGDDEDDENDEDDSVADDESATCAGVGEEVEDEDTRILKSANVTRRCKERAMCNKTQQIGPSSSSIGLGQGPAVRRWHWSSVGIFLGSYGTSAGR